jgi:hypothetical protein
MITLYLIVAYEISYLEEVGINQVLCGDKWLAMEEGN